MRLASAEELALFVKDAQIEEMEKKILELEDEVKRVKGDDDGAEADIHIAASGTRDR